MHTHGALLRNKYSHSPLLIKNQYFLFYSLAWIKSGQHGRFTHDGFVADKVTLFRSSSRPCRWIGSDMLYVRAGNERSSLSHWSGKQDNPLGSFYRGAKEGVCELGSIPCPTTTTSRREVPGIRTHGDPANAHGRSRLSRTVEINESYVRRLRRNAKEGELSLRRLFHPSQATSDIRCLPRGEIFLSRATLNGRMLLRISRVRII